jgi:hypothetical protein
MRFFRQAKIASERSGERKKTFFFLFLQKKMRTGILKTFFVLFSGGVHNGSPKRRGRMSSRKGRRHQLELDLPSAYLKCQIEPNPNPLKKAKTKLKEEVEEKFEPSNRPNAG